MGILNLEWVLEVPIEKQVRLIRRAAKLNRDAFGLLVRVYLDSDQAILPVIERELKTGARSFNKCRTLSVC